MKTDDYKKELLRVIEQKEIARMQHCFGFTTFSKATAYNHELQNDKDIKNALKKNRTKHVHTMLYKWIKSDNATLQIAAMRMLADKEDHQRLNQSYVDHTTKGEKVNNEPVTIIYNVEEPEGTE